MNRLDVSTLHLCQRCPRLVAYASHGRKQQAWRVGLAGSSPGGLFHQEVVQPLFLALAQGNTSVLGREVTACLVASTHQPALALYGIIQEHVLYPLLRRMGKKLSLQQIAHLDGGVEGLSRRLADFLSPLLVSPGVLLQHCFHPPEQEIATLFQPVNQSPVLISGRFDALLIDPLARLATLLEFKGRKASQPDEDFLQVVLYAWIIRQQTGLSVAGEIHYLEEEQGAVYTPQQLVEGSGHLADLIQLTLTCQNAIAGQHTLPMPVDASLCQVCQFVGQCTTDWGSAPLVDREESWLRENENVLITTLGQVKIAVSGQGWLLGPRFARFRLGLDLARGATVGKVLAKSRELQIALKLDTPPLIQAQAGFVGVDIPRRHLQVITLDSLLKQGMRQRPDSVVALPLGVDVNNEVFWADLAQPTMTNLLVGGMAGSGKTVFLFSCAAALMRLCTPDQVRLVMIDPKRVSFAGLGDLPHLLVPPLLELEEILVQLEQLVEEMEERYRQFQAVGVVDIGGYVAASGGMAHIVVFVDEYADLMLDRKHKVRLETAVQRLGQKGRAAGFHLILATQRPEARIVTPLIKANFHLKIAMQVGSVSNSEIILDQPGGEALLGCGDMLVGGTVRLIRLQGAVAGREEFQIH